VDGEPCPRRRAGAAYADPGADRFECLDSERLIRCRLTKRKALGRPLKLVPLADAAWIAGFYPADFRRLDLTIFAAKGAQERQVEDGSVAVRRAALNIIANGVQASAERE
jgi:hypothetical protein